MKLPRFKIKSLRLQVFVTIILGISIGALVSMATAASMSYYGLTKDDDPWRGLSETARLIRFNSNIGRETAIYSPVLRPIQGIMKANPNYWYLIIDEDGNEISHNLPPWAKEYQGTLPTKGSLDHFFYHSNDLSKPVHMLSRGSVGNHDQVIFVGGIEDSNAVFFVTLFTLLPPVLVQIFLMAIPFAFIMSFFIIRRLKKSVSALESDLSGVDLDQEFNPVADHGTPKELAPLLDSFNTTLGKLHTSYEQQRQFATDLTHELRTPIAAVMAQLQLLPPSKPNQAMLERLTQLHGFISQLLDSDRLRWGADAKRGVEINGLARNVAAQLAPLVVASEREISFSSEQDTIEIITDTTAISHVIHNLIANAILHGAGLISVTTQKDPGADHIMVKVSDQGTSLRDEDIAALSSKFQKGQGDGSGLGLSIANNIVQRLGGSLSGRVVDQKTEFTLTLPA